MQTESMQGGFADAPVETALAFRAALEAAREEIARRVAVINESTRRAYFGTATAIGEIVARYDE